MRSTSAGYTALDVAIAVGREAAAVGTALTGRAGARGERADRPATGNSMPTHPGEIYRGWQRTGAGCLAQRYGHGRATARRRGDANLRLPQGDTLLQVAADAHATRLPCAAAGAWRPRHPPITPGIALLGSPHARNDATIRGAARGRRRPDAHARARGHAAARRAARRPIDSAQTLLDAGAEHRGLRSAGPHTADARRGRRRRRLRRRCSPITRNSIPRTQRRTALWFAAWSGSPRQRRCAACAPGRAAITSDAPGSRSLHAAAAHGQAAVIARLLEEGARIDRRSAARRYAAADCSGQRASRKPCRRCWRNRRSRSCRTTRAIPR